MTNRIVVMTDIQDILDELYGLTEDCRCRRDGCSCEVQRKLEEVI